MSDFCYSGWGLFGFAAKDGASLTASYTANTLGTESGIARSIGVPDDAHLYDILFEFSAMPTGAGAPTSISFYLARDAAGTQPLTAVHTVNIVKALGAAAATGGARAVLAVDFHSTTAVGKNEYNDLHLISLLDVGTATTDVLLSWRA